MRHLGEEVTSSIGVNTLIFFNTSINASTIPICTHNRLLKNGSKLIAIHQARYFKTKTGLSLGPGLFVKGLEYAADCKAQVVGKPCADFFKAALLDTDPSEAVMIGDVSIVRNDY